MSSLAATGQKPGLLQIVDWRLVAAIGLPIWTLLIGFVLAHKLTPKPSPVAMATAQPTETPPAPPPETATPPREVVARTEIQPLPVVVPIPTPAPAPKEPAVAAAPAPPAEFQLPPSELIPGDRCQTFDTKIRFHPGLPEAAEEAKLSKKLLLVLHISGNFDDPGFT